MRKFIAILVLSTPFLCWSQTYYDMLWEQEVGLTSDYLGQTMSKTAADGWSNCGAFSDNLLPALTDGDVKYTVTELQTQRILGLSYDNLGEGLTGVDFAFQCGGGRLYIIESGSVIGQYGRVRVNDVLKVSREGAFIKYYLNAGVVRTVACDDTKKMGVDISIYHRDGDFNDVAATFDHKVYSIPTTTNCSTTTDGLVSLNIYGGTAPFTYYWGENYLSETQFNTYIAALPAEFDMSGLAYADIYETTATSMTFPHSGWHQYTVKDDNGDLHQDSALVSDELVSNVHNGISVSGMVITKVSHSGMFEASFQNGILSEEYCYVEFEVSDVSQDYIVGLRDFPSATFADGSHIKFGLAIESGDLNFRNNGVSTTLIQGVRNGDSYGYEFRNGTMYVFHNNLEIHNEAVVAGLTLMEDVFLSKGGTTITLKHHQLPLVNAYKGPRIEITDIPCGGLPETGEIQLTFPVMYSGNHFDLKDDSGGTIESNNLTGTFSNLGPGDYEIEATWGSPSSTYSYWVSVGYEFDWNPDANLITLSSEPNTLHNPSGYIGWADASNLLKPGLDGWIEFTIDWDMSQQLGSGVAFGIDDMTGTQRAAFHVTVFSQYLAWAAWDASSVQQTSGNTLLGYNSLLEKLRISRDNVDGFQFYLINGLSSLGNPYGLPQTPDPTTMYPDGSLSWLGDRIIKARASFPCDHLAQYAHLKKKLDGSYYIPTNNHVYIKYDEKYHDVDDELVYNIYDDTNSVVASNSTATLAVSWGHNMYDLDLGLLGITSAGMYTIEVINQKNEKLYLKFIL